jgi:acyl-CoA synthetase (AMP-forming)/AMP-acid ligase II
VASYRAASVFGRFEANYRHIPLVQGEQVTHPLVGTCGISILDGAPRRTVIVVSVGSETIAGAILAQGADGRRAAFVEPGGEPTSYAETRRRVLVLADALTAAGIRPGEIVGFVSPRSPLGLIGFLAISGIAVCCPLSARQRPEELSAALESMGVSTLVDGCGDRSAIEAARAMGLRVLECRASEEGVELKTVVSDCRTTPRDLGGKPGLALVMRTSGTTSKPKLVGLSHANVIAAASAIRSAYGLGEEDLCFNLMPLYHVHGLVSGGMSSLLAGSTQLCTGPLAPASFARAYEALRPTWFTGSPPVHLSLRDYYETSGMLPHNDRLRFFRSSSAPFPAPAIASLEELFGAPLYENYGMTETASTVCSNLPPPARRKVGGVGSSISAQIRIADEHGVDVSRGIEGEILLKGPSVITEYLDSDEVNAKNFHGSWLRTGDVGYFDEDGDLFVIGRTKELIKRGGQSVYPSEIDNALSDHDGVADAIAFAIEHPTLGEELVAAVVPKAGAGLSEPDLRTYLTNSVSSYKVPSAILMVDVIPKNETGKVQRREMKSIFASHFRPMREPAGDEVESVVLDIWRKVLRRDDFGATDNVFVLGADPLRSSQAAEFVREQLGLEITAKQIFRNPTVREQARFLFASG